MGREGNGLVALVDQVKTQTESQGLDVAAVLYLDPLGCEMVDDQEGLRMGRVAGKSPADQLCQPRQSRGGNDSFVDETALTSAVCLGGVETYNVYAWSEFTQVKPMYDVVYPGYWDATCPAGQVFNSIPTIRSASVPSKKRNTLVGLSLWRI